MTTTFVDYVKPRWGQHWALCRATPRTLARYDRCVSPKEYRTAETDFQRDHPAEWAQHHSLNAGDIAACLYEALAGLVLRLEAGGFPKATLTVEQAALNKARGIEENKP